MESVPTTQLLLPNKYEFWEPSVIKRYNESGKKNEYYNEDTDRFYASRGKFNKLNFNELIADEKITGWSQPENISNEVFYNLEGNCRVRLGVHE